MAFSRAHVLTVVVAAALAGTGTLGAGRALPPPHDATYAEAEPVVAAAGSEAPREVMQLPPAERPSAWARWVTERRATVMARLRRGEEDSLVPLLLFGTSYTDAPRITREFVERAARAAAADGSGATGVERALAGAFAPRVDDLLRGMQQPGANERLAWARETLERLGHRLDTAEGRARAGKYLVENFARVTRESGELAALLGGSSTARPPVDRAQVFAHRGLAPDTSWPVNFALHEALESLGASGALARGSVRRVAIVGPGLDFADKDEGHDYYPPQCQQPFAVIDALVTLKLAGAAAIEVVTLDISPRVNEHLRRLATRPAAVPYDLQFVRRRDVRWTSGASQYFGTVGASVGREVAPLKAPGLAGALDARAVRIAPGFLRRVHPSELDVVYQRLPLADEERFDLVIATNVLVYYDRFEQALASRSIEALLGPGGLLVTNTLLEDAPAFPLRRVQQTTHVFSERTGDGEVIVSYARPAASER